MSDHDEFTYAAPSAGTVTRALSNSCKHLCEFLGCNAMGGRNLIDHAVKRLCMSNAEFLSAPKALLSDGKKVVWNSVVTTSCITI